MGKILNLFSQAQLLYYIQDTDTGFGYKAIECHETMSTQKDQELETEDAQQSSCI